MLATFAAILAYFATLGLTTRSAPTVHHLQDGGVLTLAGDSSYSLCYGALCQLGDVSDIVDSIAYLAVSDCVDHSTTERTTCADADVADYVYFGHDDRFGPETCHRCGVPPRAPTCWDTLEAYGSRACDRSDSLRAVAGATVAADPMATIPTDPQAVAHCPEYVARAAALDAIADSLDGQRGNGWKSECQTSRDLAGLIPGDYGYHRGQPYDTARFDSVIRAPHQAPRGKHPCQVRGVWMLCPDRADLPAPQIVALVPRLVVAPELRTTCYAGISCSD